MKFTMLVTFFISWLNCCHQVDSAALEVVYEWKTVDFAFPADLKKTALASNSFIPANNIPIGFAIWRDKMFLTVYRWTIGVGSSLNYINISTVGKDPSPLLIPYPSVSDNFINEDPANRTVSLLSQATIVSATRPWVDKCNRLWIIDAGIVDFNNENRRITAPAIVIFDLLTDGLIRRYAIPDSQIKTDSVWANIVVDVEANNCGDAYAYVADLIGMIVYSLATNTTWRIDHNFFGDDPQSGNYQIKGVNFQWTDGLFGIAISNRLENGGRYVYFHSFAATTEYKVQNTVLKNQSYIAQGNFWYDFKYIGDRGRWSQASRSFYDEKSDVIFYPVVHKYAIKCWDTKQPLETWDTVFENHANMIFPNDVLVDANHNLWALSNSLPIFLYGAWNTNDTNFRIYRGDVDQAIQGTGCADDRYYFKF